MTGTLAIARNLLKAWILLAALASVFGGAGWLLGGTRVATVFAGCALLAAGTVYAYADRIVLGMLKARELTVAEGPALHSTVERLSALAGVPKPKLYVIADGHPRALAAGRGPNGGAIALTRGFLNAAPPAELEGVLTAYCYIEDVAHIELNGHILVPLQNIASLHCSSRCDAQDDWPPRGFLDDSGGDEDDDT